MSTESRVASARERELLESAYEYVLRNGLGSLSLRPLAQAIGSSPRVLLFLFGSKEGLVQALLARARAAELEFLGSLPAVESAATRDDLAATIRCVWQWLVARPHRALLTLWLETYARSLIEPIGPCADFARRTVEDWLELLAAHQPARVRHTRAAVTQRSLALAVLRGALLDLLATGDEERATAIVEAHIAAQGIVSSAAC